MNHRAPRSVEAGQKLLQRYALVAGSLAVTEAVRTDAIAAANQAADAEALPLVEELKQLEQLLAPWWAEHKFKLLSKGRKSAELGGCEIGSRMGGTRLALAGIETDVIEQLREARWARPYLNIKYSLNRQTTLAGLAGQHGKQLRELGFSTSAGTETFFVKPVFQSATVSETAA